MSKDKHIFNLDNLDEWLCSTGFLYPSNNIQLERFNKLYKDYDFKLKDTKIDVDSIINGTQKRTNVLKIIEDFNESEISGLKMAARNGIENLPKDIIDKMYNKHRKNNDKE